MTGYVDHPASSPIYVRMSIKQVTLGDLRRYAVWRSLFPPTTLMGALKRMGFVQADPIRAPARAQDLVLCHRVVGYRAGQLEQRYPSLTIEEDFFVNYGFVDRSIHTMMHPRVPRTIWDKATWARAEELLAFIRDRGEAHPRDVHARFACGNVKNAWGGASSATTRLLDGMHYRGLLRVSRRENGIRLYAVRASATRSDRPSIDQLLDSLIDAAVNVYAPLPAAGLSRLVGRLRYGTPQWRGQLRSSIARSKARLAHARVGGIDWYWPAGERLVVSSAEPKEEVRLLAPFDPLVWDRARFELLWSWPYRFEAYTPAPRRVFGYYALPLLWRDRIVGWANVSKSASSLHADFGYAGGKPPRDRSFKRELDAEMDRMHRFLGEDSVNEQI